MVYKNQAQLQAHANHSGGYEVQVRWQVSANSIDIKFQVEKPPTHDWVCDKRFSLSTSNWGLWEYDVVEFFYRNVTESQYHELQVSPLGQRFHLNIIEPRKRFYSPIEMSWQQQVCCEERIWFTQIQIPHDGGSIEGNFHAILGATDKPRHYFAYKVNPEQQVDFHKPQNFVPL